MALRSNREANVSITGFCCKCNLVVAKWLRYYFVKMADWFSSDLPAYWSKLKIGLPSFSKCCQKQKPTVNDHRLCNCFIINILLRYRQGHTSLSVI